MRFLSSKVRGFTLVEIVVVVAITGMLAMIVIANVQEGRKKAANAVRISELQQLEVAIRVYKDVYGVYPLPGCGADISQPHWSVLGPILSSPPFPWYFQCENYIEGLVPDFIAQFPDERRIRNNLQTGQSYYYRVSTDRNEYKLLAHGIVEGGPVNPGESFARCAASCTEAWCYANTYAIYSPGAACW